MTSSPLVRLVLLAAISTGEFACSSDGPASQGGDGGQSAGGLTSSTGGKSATGGGANSGGTLGPGSATGGNYGTVGKSATGGSGAIGGNVATGGKSATGGSGAIGGNVATGGKSTGGNSHGPTGGVVSTGGSAGKGGTTGAAGGTGGNTGSAKTGGTGSALGGNSSATTSGTGGGLPGTGGQVSGGTGAGTGGKSSTVATTGGSGGSTAYNPCKASPCVILPLGDSITHGWGSSDDAGYRVPLYKLAVAANQQVTFTGHQSNGNNVPTGFVKLHEGHDGITVTNLTNSWLPPEKPFVDMPHIVLLHIGTNDMTSNADPTTTAKSLNTLITKVVAAAPDALVVVAKIVPLGYTNGNYTSYIAQIPDVVKQHADKNEHVILVDMSTLPSSDIKGNSDVHPTDKGYSDMANLWYGVIKGYLP